MLFNYHYTLIILVVWKVCDYVIIWMSIFENLLMARVASDLFLEELNVIQREIFKV